MPSEEDQPRGPRLQGLWWPLLAGLLLLLLTGAVATQLDLDGDGMDTWDEWQAGTSPWHGDSDRDGLLDGFETDRRLDPLSLDTDEDGLDDRTELEQETDPRRPDTDEDELDDARERMLGTDPRTSDTDEDGVRDTEEVRIATDPLSNDTDGDGLDDADELLLGADPWVVDTDGDGWEDATEAELGPEDCDGDGYDRIADADDDNDRIVDLDEEDSWRCQQDTDGDGIVDGEERARACVELTDCDIDGLQDIEELGTAFDRLHPDTFDVGLLDGVSYAFQQAGQSPSGDEDADGIPDAWENSEGLITWEHFDPEPGQRDLLVEFVRVQGPDSARFGPSSMAPAYHNVARFFQQQGDVEMAWIETTVRLEEERRPPLIPSSLDAYYREVLQRAEASANPYVTTVVMNPQHDQRNIQHQGVAPIRGMLAAVDYGAHTSITFEAEEGSITISPYVESLVAADRIDLFQRSSITDGGTMADGRMFLTHPDWQLVWRPFWFATPPVQRFEDGSEIVYERQRTVLDRAELADTIAHELGHTLGLCHTNLPDCRANLSTEDQDEVGVSTMDERRRTSELAFLDSEWSTLRAYATCPPQRSITMIAEGADRASVIDAKYEITLENVLNVDTRECRELDPIGPDLDAAIETPIYDPPYTFSAEEIDDPPTVYQAASQDRVPDAEIQGPQVSLVYTAGSVLASIAVGFAVARWRR